MGIHLFQDGVYREGFATQADLNVLEMRVRAIHNHS